MNIISITNQNICIKYDDIFVKITTNLKHIQHIHELYDKETQYFCLPIPNYNCNCNEINEKQILCILCELEEKKGDEIPLKVKKRALHKHWKAIFEQKSYFMSYYPLMDGDIEMYVENNYENYKNMVIFIIKALSILEKYDKSHGDLHVKNVLYKRGDNENDDNDDKIEKFVISDLDTLCNEMTMSWHATQPRWLEKRCISLIHKPLNSVYWDLFVFMNSLNLTLKSKKKVVQGWMIKLEKESLQRALKKDKNDKEDKEDKDTILNLIKLV